MEEQIIKLINRYKNKIQWLNIHKNVNDTKIYEGNIEAFQTIIDDLIDLLDGIDM